MHAVNTGPARIDTRAAVLLVVLCASWGLQQISIKIAVQSVPPALQGGIRSIGAAMLIYLWMVVRREKIVFARDTFRWGLAVGVFFSIEFLLIYWGLEFTDASRSVIFLYTMPFMTALGAHWYIPGESLERMQATGLGCAFFGIVVAFSESVGGPRSSMLIGDAMLLLAAFFWAAATIVVKATPLCTMRASMVLFYQLLVSAVLLPLGALLLGQTRIVQATPLILGCLAYQAVWVAFVTYLAWFWLIKHYPAARLSAFLFLTPLFGVLEGSLLLHEQITYRLWTALALVSAGIYLVNRTPGKKTCPSEKPLADSR